MKKLLQLVAAGAVAYGALCVSPAAAQDPIVTPIIASTAAPIIVSAIKPKPKASGLVKFEGFVLHANRAQVTVRARGNDMAIQTFALSDAAANKMQQIVDNGGYQYGDKITLEYDAQSLMVMKFKGRPSKPL